MVFNSHSQLTSGSIRIVVFVVVIIIIHSIGLPLQRSLLSHHLVLKLTAFTNSSCSQHYLCVLSGPDWWSAGGAAGFIFYLHLTRGIRGEKRRKMLPLWLSVPPFCYSDYVSHSDLVVKHTNCHVSCVLDAFISLVYLFQYWLRERSTLKCPFTVNKWMACQISMDTERKI